MVVSYPTALFDFYSQRVIQSLHHVQVSSSVGIISPVSVLHSIYPFFVDDDHKRHIG